MNLTCILIGVILYMVFTILPTLALFPMGDDDAMPDKQHDGTADFPPYAGDA